MSEIAKSKFSRRIRSDSDNDHQEAESKGEEEGGTEDTHEQEGRGRGGEHSVTGAQTAAAAAGTIYAYRGELLRACVRKLFRSLFALTFSSFNTFLIFDFSRLF